MDRQIFFLEVPFCSLVITILGLHILPLNFFLQFLSVVLQSIYLTLSFLSCVPSHSFVHYSYILQCFYLAGYDDGGR